MSCRPKTVLVSNRATRPLEKFIRYFELLDLTNCGGGRCSRDPDIHSREQHGWGSGVRRARAYALMGLSVSHRREPAVVWKPTATVRTTALDSKIAAAQGRECTEQKAHRGRLETLAYYKAVLIEATVDDGEEEGQQFSLS